MISDFEVDQNVKLKFVKKNFSLGTEVGNTECVSESYKLVCGES